MGLPFRNIRVLELGRVFAAPWAGQMLADLGAEVIKVESVDGGDMTRTLGTGVIKDADGNATSEHSLFAALNRNKKSITVDISKPEGQDVVRKLAAKCDVFLENYKVGDLGRRGLDYASIVKLNPKIIYLSLSGYGQTGPYRERPGMDDVIQGYVGYKAITGAKGGPPSGSPVSIIDFSAGMHAVVGIISALYARDVNGEPGQHIDLALMDSGMALMGYKMVAFMLSGKQEARGQRTRGYSPGGVVATKDGYMQVIIGPNHEFERLCKAIGREDFLKDDRFNDRWRRHENTELVQATFEEIYRSRTTVEWNDLLNAHGLLVSPVNDLHGALADPQIAFRGVVKKITHELGGQVELVGNPINFSETPITEYRSPPLLNQNSTEVLQGLLGFSDTEIETMRQAGAVG